MLNALSGPGMLIAIFIGVVLVTVFVIMGIFACEKIGVSLAKKHTNINFSRIGVWLCGGLFLLSLSVFALIPDSTNLLLRIAITLAVATAVPAIVAQNFWRSMQDTYEKERRRQLSA